MRPFVFLLTCALLAQPDKQMKGWVDPVKEDLPPTHYKLFHNEEISPGDYSYLVYLPPDYDATKKSAAIRPSTGCTVAAGISAEARVL